MNEIEKNDLAAMMAGVYGFLGLLVKHLGESKSADMPTLMLSLDALYENQSQHPLTRAVLNDLREVMVGTLVRLGDEESEVITEDELPTVCPNRQTPEFPK